MSNTATVKSIIIKMKEEKNEKLATEELPQFLLQNFTYQQFTNVLIAAMLRGEGSLLLIKTFKLLYIETQQKELLSSYIVNYLNNFYQYLPLLGIEYALKVLIALFLLSTDILMKDFFIEDVLNNQIKLEHLEILFLYIGPIFLSSLNSESKKELLLSLSKTNSYPFNKLE